MIIFKPIELVFIISGIDGYGFGRDKLLYNIKTGRAKKQCYNNGSLGYWFGKRFLSLKALRPLLINSKHNKQNITGGTRNTFKKQ